MTLRVQPLPYTYALSASLRATPAGGKSHADQPTGTEYDGVAAMEAFASPGIAGSILHSITSRSS